MKSVKKTSSKKPNLRDCLITYQEFKNMSSLRSDFSTVCNKPNKNCSTKHTDKTTKDSSVHSEKKSDKSCDSDKCVIEFPETFMCEEQIKCCTKEKMQHFIQNFTQGDANITVEIESCEQPHQKVTSTFEGENTCVTIELTSKCHREKITFCVPTGNSGGSGLCTQCPPPFQCVGNEGVTTSGFITNYIFSNGASYNTGPSAVSPPQNIGVTGINGGTSAYFITPIDGTTADQVGVYYQIPITIPSTGISGSNTILSVAFPQGLTANQFLCEASFAGYSGSTGTSTSIASTFSKLTTNIINNRIVVAVPSTMTLKGVPFPNNLVNGRLQTYIIISVTYLTNQVLFNTQNNNRNQVINSTSTCTNCKH